MIIPDSESTFAAGVPPLTLGAESGTFSLYVAFELYLFYITR